MTATDEASSNFQFLYDGALVGSVVGPGRIRDWNEISRNDVVNPGANLNTPKRHAWKPVAMVYLPTSQSSDHGS